VASHLSEKDATFVFFFNLKQIEMSYLVTSLMIHVYFLFVLKMKIKNGLRKLLLKKVANVVDSKDVVEAVVVGKEGGGGCCWKGGWWW
jgi:hypothetical protein